MIEQAEYGYMEGKSLRSRLIKPITRTWVDGDGVQHTETESVEQQIAALSEEWKPVDAISPEALVSEDENYIIVPVPYDQGGAHRLPLRETLRLPAYQAAGG